jgi:hypothetical protein
MGRACSTNGEEAVSDHSEDQGVGGKIILGWNLEKWDKVMWTGLIWLRIRNQWQALVNTAMNLQHPQNVAGGRVGWKFLSSCATVGFSKRTQLLQKCTEGLTCYDLQFCAVNRHY